MKIQHEKSTINQHQRINRKKFSIHKHHHSILIFPNKKNLCALIRKWHHRKVNKGRLCRKEKYKMFLSKWKRCSTLLIMRTHWHISKSLIVSSCWNVGKQTLLYYAKGSMNWYRLFKRKFEIVIKITITNYYTSMLICIQKDWKQTESHQ